MSRCMIVVPCYNEAARLNAGEFKGFAQRGHVHRFLFVNDGSTDDTLRVLKSLRDFDPQRFGIHDLPHNVGKAEAVRQGILQALLDDPELVGFWDADLATPLNAIPELCAVLEANPALQMVMGSRVRLLGRSIRRRPVRHYLGRVFATAASLVLGLPVYDTQCGAKVFRVSPEVRLVFDEPFRTNWVFDVELLARLVRIGYVSGEQPAENVAFEVPLSEWRDVAGSKVRLRDFLKAAFELALIYRTYGRRASGTWRPAEPVVVPMPTRGTRRKAV